VSRIGNKPIPVPAGVTVSIQDGTVAVKGKSAELKHEVNPGITVKVADGQIVVERASDEREHRALHGLTRALVANMVTGVTTGFTRSLDIVGYRVAQQGSGVNLQIGFSHPVVVQPKPGTRIEVEGQNKIHVRGADKQLVGQMAAEIRRIRPPDSYKGKGIRYTGEQVRLKPGKAAGKRA